MKTNSNSVNDSATYADGFIYVDNEVKNWKIYGDKHNIPLHNFLILGSTTEINQSNEYIINKKLMSNEGITLNIEEAIKENIIQSLTLKIIE